MSLRQPLLKPSMVVFLRRPCGLWSIAVTVGNKPDPFSSVRGADTCSRKYKRPNVVTFAFQVSLHLLEDQPGIAINNSANIFRKDPSGTYFANCSKHLRTEVAIVPVSSPLPRVAEGLTVKDDRKDKIGRASGRERGCKSV